MSELLDIDIRHTIHAATGPVDMEICIGIEKGSVFALTGPSGAGKTTLLKHIAGLAKPDSGTIEFGGDVWYSSSKSKCIPVQQRKVGFVFQDYALFPNFSVRQNLVYALPKGDSEDIVDELLDATELSEFGNRKPYQLSGGQQQRAAIARAIASRPQLLLLDEPMSALDSDFRQKAQELLLEFHRKYELTMIIVTHQLPDIFQLASKVAVMKEGKIVKAGTPSQVFLAEGEDIGQSILYAEVLAVAVSQGITEVSVLLNHKIFKLKLPSELRPDLKAGTKIAIPVESLLHEFRIIDAISTQLRT